jgi:hypothetical protein
MNKEEFDLILKDVIIFDKEMKMMGEIVRLEKYPDSSKSFRTSYDFDDGQVKFTFSIPAHCGCCGDDEYCESYPLDIVIDNNLILRFKEEEKKKERKAGKISAIPKRRSKKI